MCVYIYKCQALSSGCPNNWYYLQSLVLYLNVAKQSSLIWLPTMLSWLKSKRMKEKRLCHGFSLAKRRNGDTLLMWWWPWVKMEPLWPCLFVSIIGRSCHKYHFCHYESFVTTNTFVLTHMFVLTKVCLSWQNYVCCDKSHDKSKLVMTKLCLLWQKSWQK